MEDWLEQDLIRDVGFGKNIVLGQVHLFLYNYDGYAIIQSKNHNRHYPPLNEELLYSIRLYEKYI